MLAGEEDMALRQLEDLVAEGEPNAETTLREQAFDHLVGDARIIASEASAKEMEALPPAALAAMQMRLHVYLEKPLAVTATQAERMIARGSITLSPRVPPR